MTERGNHSEDNQTSTTELDLNNNNNTYLTVDATRNEKWKIPRKPKSLFLEQSMKETSFPSNNPSSFGVFDKADSPLMGMVPSPTYGLTWEQDCAKCNKNGDHYVSAQTAYNGGNNDHLNVTDSKLKEQTNVDINRRSPTADGNSIKLGKFALLRKYRNSLEESDPVTATDVTVEGVTVTVRESDNPQGFFSPCMIPPKHWNVS